MVDGANSNGGEAALVDELALPPLRGSVESVDPEQYVLEFAEIPVTGRLDVRPRPRVRVAFVADQFRDRSPNSV